LTPSTPTSDGSGRLHSLDRLRRPSWGGSIGLFVVLAGWVIGLRPLSDNSFLTHLATGRIILDTSGVPSVDAYTFTAAGEPWVVQSWLVSWLYGTAEQVAGLAGVRIVVGVLAAALAGLVWALLRPAQGVLARLAGAAVVLTVGAGQWAERPFMVGLVCFALTALAMEDRLDPRWLLPIGWLWVNSHGSFPLGVGLLVVAALGDRLDGGRGTVELRCLRWAVPGVLLGAVGPIGPRLLVFPLELLRKQELLSTVVEWRAPTFDTASQRVFVLQLGLAVVLLARRPSYRASLIVGVFTAAALLGARNVAVASVAILPAVAPALAGLGSLASADRPRAARLAGAAGVALVAVLTVARLDQTDLNLRRYPVAALAFLEGEGVDTRQVRMAAPDYVGNLLGFVYGPQGRVFYDDRFDMFPDEVSEANQAVLTGAPDVFEELAGLDVDLVLVRSESAVGQRLRAEPGWRMLYVDDEWALSCRRASSLGGTLGTC
jgi:hypothetical protein